MYMCVMLIKKRIAEFDLLQLVYLLMHDLNEAIKDGYQIIYKWIAKF